jgi:hypothetical protein
MTKSIDVVPEVPLRVVELLSDCKGAYGIAINSSAWEAYLKQKAIKKKAKEVSIDDETDQHVDHSFWEEDQADESAQGKAEEPTEQEADDFILDDEAEEPEWDDDLFLEGEAVGRLEQRVVEPIDEDDDFFNLDDEADELEVHKAEKSNRKEYRPLVLRPDVVRASAVIPDECRNTLLHTIGNRCWAHSYEWDLLEAMHDAALARNERFVELQQEEEQLGGYKKWRKGERGTLYRQIKWGQRKRQFIVLNGMLKRLIAEAADPAALKLARRFHPTVRENIYRAAAISHRAQQLIDVFPALGVEIYCPPNKREYWEEKAPNAAQMVERGEKLSQIAGFMQIPMSAREGVRNDV